MAITLRDYQADLLRQVQAALAGSTKARVMMQLPTGAGKTEIAGALIADWLKNRPSSNAVWLTHRKHLQRQTGDRLNGTEAKPTYGVSWSRGPAPVPRRNGTAILSAQTAGRRANKNRKQTKRPYKGIWEKYTYNDLMVIDEAHHATAPGWKTAMEQWPGRIVGITATPWRLIATQGFEGFDTLVSGPQIAEMQSMGWLCQSRVWVPTDDSRIKPGRRPGPGGDYSDNDIINANLPDVMTGQVVKLWQEHADNRQTVAYAISVEHAGNLARTFNSAGIPTAVILGSTNDDERRKAIDGFLQGNYKVLVNVLVATEGFDLPDASCIVLTRPTLSLALYLQMVGRGLRRKADGGDCLILDLAANVERHGLPEADREWSLKPRGINEGTRPAPVVQCQKCGDIESAASSHNCKNCNEPFGKPCGRCGKWRAWARWELVSKEEPHEEPHQEVCDFCHADAHFLAKLPAPKGGPSKREEDLQRRIDDLEEILKDKAENPIAGERFEAYLKGLPENQRPQNTVAHSRMCLAWVQGLKTELTELRAELEQLAWHRLHSG